MASPTDTSTNASSQPPNGTHDALPNAIRQLSLSVRDIHHAVDRLYFVIDRETSVNETALITVPNALATGTQDSFEHVPVPPSSPSESDQPVLISTSDAAPAEEQHRYYAVIVGREPGVFSRSSDITANVQRIPGSHLVKCTSEADAQQIFDVALAAGQVERVELVINRTTLSREDFPPA